jgi:voltage-gated potassium channel
MTEARQGLVARWRKFQRAHKFVLLFYCLLSSLLIFPFVEDFFLAKEIVTILQTAIFFSIIYTCLNDRRLFSFVLIMGAMAFTGLWWEYAFCSTFAAVMTSTITGLLFLILAVVIIRGITSASETGLNAIFAAVSAYLLLAFAWGYLFAIVELLHPGSFSRLGDLTCGKFIMVPFWNVSFLTITTLGYVDVTPIYKISKALAIIEAIVGQLYLVVVVALLVGLHAGEIIEKRRRR